MYWKDGKGANPGSWHGPARVLMVERYNLVWISNMTKLFQCAPEHARPLSQDEASSITGQDQGLQLPERSGNGAFQFRELSSQEGPTPVSVVPQGNHQGNDPEAASKIPICNLILLQYQIHHHPPLHNPMMNLQYHLHELPKTQLSQLPFLMTLMMI